MAAEVASPRTSSVQPKPHQRPSHSPRKRAATSPSSSMASSPAKKPFRQEIELTAPETPWPPLPGPGSDAYKAAEARVEESLSHVPGLSPAVRAERKEYCINNTLEIQYYFDHPDELLAKIRETNPTFDPQPPNCGMKDEDELEEWANQLYARNGFTEDGESSSEMESNSGAK